MLRRERALIFARSWQYGGRADQVAEPGTYLATDAGGVPILVTRDRQGDAARVRQRLPPPRRGADGRLRQPQHPPVPLPRVDLRPRRLVAQRAALGSRGRLRQRRLVAACRPRVDTWGPFLFVNPDPAAAPLADHLGELPAILARDDRHRHDRVPLARRVRRERELEDRGRELPRVLPLPDGAPSFSEAVDVHPDRYLLEAHPTFAAQFAEAKQTGERGQFHLLFPNTGLNVFPGPREPLDRADRTRRAGPHRALPRLLLRARARRRRGSPSSSPSTTRSAARTPCSSSRCIAAWPPGWSSAGRLLLNAEPLLAAFQRWVESQLAAA